MQIHVSLVPVTWEIGLVFSGRGHFVGTPSTLLLVARTFLGSIQEKSRRRLALHSSRLARVRQRVYQVCLFLHCLLRLVSGSTSLVQGSLSDGGVLSVEARSRRDRNRPAPTRRRSFGMGCRCTSAGTSTCGGFVSRAVVEGECC